jgi:uncharacterized protein YxjI
VDLDDLQRQDRLQVRQKITAFVNRYAVSLPSGETIAFVEQKRFAFREQVTFYTDESRRRPLFGFKARSIIDVGTTYDVTGADGTMLGRFRKDFARSLLRSTWHLEPATGPPAVGRERSLVIAVLRRVWDLIPFTDIVPFAVPYHFDFASDGRRVMAVEKRWGLRDRYDVIISAPTLDRRLAIAQAVALDALQSR